MAVTLPYPRGDFFHVIVHEDTIIGYGVGFNNEIEWKQGLVVAKLDTLGNVLAHNFILDSAGDKFATHHAWGNLIRTADGGYAAMAATVGRESAFLIKMANDLQVEFIKEYPDTVNLSNYFYKLLETPDGYLLYGDIQRPDYYLDGFIQYVDKQGETIWFKTITFSGYNNAVLDIYQLNDSTYVAGIGTETNPNPNQGIASLLYFNLEGMDIDSWSSPVDPEIGYFRKFVHASDDGIFCFSVYKTGMNGNTALFQPTLYKLNSTFQTEWVRHFGRISGLSASIMLWDFAPTPDGHYIGAGETLVKDGNDPTRRVGWLYKFSTDGDSIWERKINAPFLPLYYTNSGFFAGVGVLSSGNIIAGGSSNEGNTQYAWLVKVTNDGCVDTLFCESVSTTVALPDNQRPEVDIYPVPASKYFTIRSPVEIVQVTVLDALGKPVLKRPNVGNDATIDVPVFVTAGFYFVEIQMEGGICIRKKVYVNK
ncbi:MAG: T9SS type A sorting domain-containing protein [Bacteroidetes bacterium]|nr:T9SS type A sorting domain-containing protein [Bacteroidota bacterium]